MSAKLKGTPCITAYKYYLFREAASARPPFRPTHPSIPETNTMKLHILGSCSGTEPEPGRHHTSLMLEVNGPAPDFGKSVLNEARIKLDNYLHYGKEPDFSREEEIALLYEPAILEEASLELKLK